MLKYIFNKVHQYKHKHKKVFCKDEECPICTEIIDHEYVPKYICNHHYHEQCIQEWFKISPLCPICRRDLNIIHLSNLYRDANLKMLHDHLVAITQIVKHIYIHSSKNTHSTDVIIRNFSLVYYEMDGHFTVWNETNPQAYVSIIILYRRHLYKMKIPTIHCYQTIEPGMNCFKPRVKTVLRVIFLHLIEMDLSFMNE